uniref:site-specific integrase n=1 Tax=Frankia sp. Cr1 TaxID=3073931 RepID=UPI002AD59528
MASNRYPGVSRHCGCRDGETGAKLGAKCPKRANPRHGTWQWRCDIGPGVDAKTGQWKSRRQASGVAATAKEASDARAAALKEVSDGTYAENSGMSVADGLKVAMDAKKLKGLAESTLHGYQDHIDLYLVPHLGRLPLRDLRAGHLEAMYVAILAGNDAKVEAKKRPVRQPTIVAVHRTVRALCSVLRRRRLIPFNPASDVELATPDKPEVLVWTGEQIGQFLDYCESENDPLTAAFHVTACLGLRRGELCGLRWAYLDLDAATVTIPSTPGATIITVGGKARLSKPKTRRSARTGVLDSDAVEALRRWHRRQAAQKLAMGAAWSDSGLVFTQADGSAWHPDTVSSRFETLSRHAKLPK